MFFNLFFSFLVMCSLLAQTLEAIPSILKKEGKENQENIIKRKFEDDNEDEHSNKKLKLKQKILRFAEKTSNGDLIREPFAETTKQPDTHQKRLIVTSHEMENLLNNNLFLPKIILIKDSQETEKKLIHVSLESIAKSLERKKHNLSKSINVDETWEWGFNVLARFWGIETEPYEMDITNTEQTILDYIDCGLAALLGDVEANDEFDAERETIFSKALKEYTNASSVSFEKSRKFFTLSKTVFNQYGLTKTSYNKTLTTEEKNKNTSNFLKKKEEIFSQKTTSFRKRYQKRHEKAEDIITDHFVPDSDTEGEDLLNILRMNDKLAMSVSEFAEESSNTNLTPIEDHETFTTREQRRLLLISLKMFLYRPLSWEEKMFFNKFSPDFFKI